MTSKKEKVKRISVFVCARCGSCFFDDEDAAKECFDNNCNETCIYD